MIASIKAKKFLLRPFKKTDSLYLSRNITKNVCDTISAFDFPFVLSDARHWVEESLKEQKKKKPIKIDWAIEINNETVGSVSLIIKDQKAEISYWLSERFWGQGITSEAVKKVTDFGFKRLGFKRIYAEVFVNNQASIAVLRKLGYKQEGLLKNNNLKNSRLIDSYIFARTK